MIKNKYKCIEDEYTDLIIKNEHVFKKLHERKGIKLSDWDNYNDIEVIPITINIFLDTKKYKINFIKYAKYIVDTINEGYSGKINCKYKNTQDNENFKYNKEYIKMILEYNNIDNVDRNASIIYNYINNNTDTKIRFYLDSIVYHNIYLEETFENGNTEKFIHNIKKKGFYIREEHKKNLNINILNFTCKTLGVSIFPWMKYIIANIPSYMQVFIDYRTIHKDIAENSFNQCRTLIHEIGHVFGLRHTFSCDETSLRVYSILLGKLIVQRELLNKINLDNHYNDNKIKKVKYNNDIVKETIDVNDLKHFKAKLEHDNKHIQLYPDVVAQQYPTGYNPFEVKKFPFYNNIPCNFCCFMDYSPDAVLTHFTPSQTKIMHYMIRIFKPYLIKKTQYEKTNLDNCKVKLFINTEEDNENTSVTDTDKIKYYKIYYDKNNHLKYNIKYFSDTLAEKIYF